MTTAIAIIAPDGNRVTGFFANLPLAELEQANLGDPRVTRIVAIDTRGDWPFRFDRVHVCEPDGWRAYEPDDLPLQYW